MLNSIGRDAGFAGWAALGAWGSQPHPKEEEAQVVSLVRGADAVTPARAIRTTPRDMAMLLRLIWSDQGGPAAACQRVRQIMSQQLTRHRLAAAFPPPARVSAKSGSLIGVIRNEVGVIEYPDGRGYAAAVFTQAQPGRPNDAAINTAIGTAAAAAVRILAEIGSASAEAG
jgi:beta-lactamase class A